DILHSDFSKYHEKLINLAELKSVRYVFSSITKKRCEEIARLAGYGAVLNIKSTAYMAVDDHNINLYSESIPEILTNYTQNDQSIPVETLEEPHNWEEIFYSSVKLLSNENPDLRLKKLVDLSQNLPFYTQLNLPADNVGYLNGNPIKNNLSPFEYFFIPEECSKLINGAISTRKYDYKIDIRSPYIMWLNNVETDYRYSYMSGNVNQFLYHNMAENIYPVRLNIFNLVIFVDPSSSSFFSMISLIYRMIMNNFPIRFGVVLVTNNQSLTSLALSRAFSSLMIKSKMASAIKLIQEVIIFTQDGILDLENIIKCYKKIDERDSILISSQSHDSDEFLQNSSKFYFDLGFRAPPSVVFNGHILDLETVDNNLFYAVILTYNKIVAEIKRELLAGTMRIARKTEETFMGGNNFYHKVNFDILTHHQNSLFIYSVSVNDCEFDKKKFLNSSQIYYCLLRKGLYLQSSSISHQTIWIILNLEDEFGKEFLLELLRTNFTDSIRLGVIFSYVPLSLNPTVTDVVAELLMKSGSLTDIKRILELDKPDWSVSFKGDLANIRNGLKSHKFYSNLFGIFDEKNYVIHSNGKYGPLTESYIFTSEDFLMSVKMHEHLFDPLINGNLKELIIQKLDGNKSELTFTDMSDIITNILSFKTTQTFVKIPEIPSSESFSIHMSPKKSAIFLQLDVFLDPTKENTQKWTSIVSTLYEAVNIKLRIFLFDPEYQMNEKFAYRFYRYVLNSAVKFNGRKVDPYVNIAVFDNLLDSVIHTFHAETLQSWFVESVFANCDMDNIILRDSKRCIGVYRLHSLMVEGHAYDSIKGSAASGLQLVLGNSENPYIFDTIGYFQFKGYPGAFYLNIKETRNTEYSYVIERNSIVSVTTGSSDVVAVDSFLGQLIKVQVVSSSTGEKPISKSDTQWWSKISREEITNLSTINIFSLATGLLYERFMRIMILSVLKHTKTPVKFWFLKNYASPQFTYEYVQYQWPHWLLKQTEKQRIIWGYKILFLDVLFPLDVPRIIFVDADQIVRADLNELYQMDMSGAPYAYTPFCDDRPEMESFRFWKKGYWRDHLRGKSYHISALYLVDLYRFREMMAGDRIRGQYQMLSRDPKSLANLDQDDVPIKSLPIEWLWCETWCSDRSKDKAKTIDMCNNPLTHEGKLDRAKRIAPEW
ncbi:hypothetical protein MXB_3930, partial [Myxobolus squamalis]